MKNTYSRKTQTEERKNIRKTYSFVILSIAIVTALLFYGIPLVVRYAGFITDIKQSSEPFTTDDSTPPAPPQLDITTEATNQKDVDINGNSEPGSTLILSLNSQKQEVLVNKEGRFSLHVNLNEGSNTLSAVSRDTAGNESSKTQTYNLTYDITPPSLEITKPDNNHVYYGSEGRQITIEGMTESGSRLSINQRTVVVENNGRFVYTTSLTEGENIFTLKSEDKAGNASESELKLTFNN